jgi:hypothetical protein
MEKRSCIPYTIIVILFVNLVSATLQPNESVKQYQQRVENDLNDLNNLKINITCGDNLCEGTEFETCSSDCKDTIAASDVDSTATGGTKLERIKTSNFKFLILVVSIIVSAIICLSIIFYFLWKRKKRSKGSAFPDIWNQLGVSKDYILRVESYIKQQLKMGFQFQTIKRDLINSGHDPKIIDKIFEQITKK